MNAKPMLRPWYSFEYSNEPTRPLTEEEKTFVKEANDHYFQVLYADDGHPFAMGATKTGGVFSANVEEVEDRGNYGSIYRLVREEGYEV